MADCTPSSNARVSAERLSDLIAFYYDDPTDFDKEVVSALRELQERRAADEPSGDREDMENIGRAFMESLHHNLPGYSWSQCPSEVIIDLVNERDELKADIEKALANHAADLNAEPPDESLSLLQAVYREMDNYSSVSEETLQAVELYLRRNLGRLPQTKNALQVCACDAPYREGYECMQPFNSPGIQYKRLQFEKRACELCDGTKVTHPAGSFEGRPCPECPVETSATTSTEEK